MDEQPFVEVRDVWKVFGKDPKRILKPTYRDLSKEEILDKTGAVLAMRDISFRVEKGELFVLMGLSGSGKSTLIRTFLRLIEPTAGSILVDGQDVTAMDRDDLQEFRRHRVSMVFQHYGLFPHYTVLENAAYGLKTGGVPEDQRLKKAREALETVGLAGWEDYYPHNLSGGMQQRVGLARALATEPDLLLMDEPFSGLDPLIRRQMQDELVDLQDKLHKTIIFVTHDLHEALKLGDRIAIMRNGEIIQLGTPEEVVTEPADDYVREFVQDASPAKVLTAENIMDDPEVLLYAWEGPKTARRILADSKREWAFMVNKRKEYLGLVTIDEIDRTKPRSVDDLRALAQKEIGTCAPDAYVEELFPIAAESAYPIPVIDSSNKLLGVVRYRAIFDSISKSMESEANTDDEEPGAPTAPSPDGAGDDETPATEVKHVSVS